MIDNRPYGIDFKDALDTLHQSHNPLHTHTGVDALGCERFILLPFPLDVLDEHQVPKLHEPFTVTARLAVWAAAAERFAAVEINLGTGAAGVPHTDFPEVVLLAQAHDSIRRHTDTLAPNGESFFVILVDADPQLVFGKLHVFGDKLPSPGNRFRLEVITEGKIAQHFKKSGMTVRLAHIFQVRSAQAALAGCHPPVLRFGLPQEIRFKGNHARAGQKQAVVPVRDQRGAGQDFMVFRFKEFQEHGTHLISCNVLHHTRI